MFPGQTDVCQQDSGETQVFAFCTTSFGTRRAFSVVGFFQFALSLGHCHYSSDDKPRAVGGGEFQRSVAVYRQPARNATEPRNCQPRPGFIGRIAPR